VRFLPLLSVAAVLAACAHRDSQPGTPPAPPARSANHPLTRVRDQVDALLRAQGETYWRAFTQGEPVDLASTWKGRESLLAPETLQAVAAERDRAQGEERRALGHLHAFLAGEQLARATADAASRAAAARGAAAVSWGGREVADRQVATLLANEPEASRRQQLAAAQAAAAEKWLPLVEARTRALEDAARALGYDGTLALAAELRGELPETLAALAESALARTEGVYRDLVTDLAQRRLGLPLERVRSRDLPRLLRSAADPGTFPAERQQADLAATLHGLGIDLGAQRNVVVDAAPKADKVPRPIALPVEVPGSVRLSFAPVAGVNAMQALLHEAGAAEFWAHVRSPVLEFRRLGPASIPETWAQLLEGLAGDPLWLSERGLEGEALREEVRAAAARRLHATREAAARVIFEIARARDPAGAAAAWPALAERAFLHPVDEDATPPWRSDPDPLLHAAEALRARLLAARAEVFLAERAGAPAWWRSKRAGEWLRTTWAAGSRHTPEELAAAMGAKGLDGAALERIARARAGMGTARP
jgi:hypothetical protein